MSDKVKNTVLIVSNVGPTKAPSNIDVAWMAGLYEGEGSAKATDGRTTVRIYQKDPEILFRCREMLGGRIYKTRASSDKYLHVLIICGDSSRLFLQSIYPFLSVRRKLQAEKAGAFKLTGKGHQSVTAGDMDNPRRERREEMNPSQKQVESVLAHKDRNREKVLAYQREHVAAKRAENPEKYREANRRAYAKHRLLQQEKFAGHEVVN